MYGSKTEISFGIGKTGDTGISLGVEQATRSNILSFYKNNVPVSLIATSVGKSEAEVQEIIRQGQAEPSSC